MQNYLNKKFDIEKVKNAVAREKGYPNWKEMENFIINHNMPVNVAILLVEAMEQVCFQAIEQYE